MVFVFVIGIFSAIPAWLIFRQQGGVRRAIAAYVAGFLLGVVLSVLWAEAWDEILISTQAWE
jgi:hypothetical protein